MALHRKPPRAGPADGGLPLYEHVRRIPAIPATSARMPKPRGSRHAAAPALGPGQQISSPQLRLCFLLCVLLYFGTIYFADSIVRLGQTLGAEQTRSRDFFVQSDPAGDAVDGGEELARGNRRHHNRHVRVGGVKEAAAVDLALPEEKNANAQVVQEEKPVDRVQVDPVPMDQPSEDLIAKERPVDDQRQQKEPQDSAEDGQGQVVDAQPTVEDQNHAEEQLPVAEEEEEEQADQPRERVVHPRPASPKQLQPQEVVNHAELAAAAAAVAVPPRAAVKPATRPAQPVAAVVEQVARADPVAERRHIRSPPKDLDVAASPATTAAVAEDEQGQVAAADHEEGGAMAADPKAVDDVEAALAVDDAAAPVAAVAVDTEVDGEEQGQEADAVAHEEHR